MKKNKLYLILAIITAVILFATAAICNQCSPGEELTPPDEEPPEEPPGEEPPPEEEPTEEELSEPTIDLEIYEGPFYSADDGVCYWRVEAIVTGNPKPEVEFNRDDSGGAWSDDNIKRAQVNLSDPGEIFTLTATATNSEGSDNDSLDLSWDCEAENQDPVISEITLMGTKYISRTYGLGVSVSDPDGDSLTYNWSVTGGIIDDASAQNINWTTPPTYGNYTISVTVSDSKGGEASAHSNVDVHFLYDLLAEASSAYWKTGDGHIDFGGSLDDPRGFALYRTDIELEDGNTYSKVLETHPRWTNSGWIAGMYSGNITIPDGAKFTAKVGFIKGATATDGVRFHIRFFYDGTAYTYDLINADYDGVLDDLNIDLSLLYGKTGQIQLIVGAGGSSSAQDWAVWVNPQITN